MEYEERELELTPKDIQCLIWAVDCKISESDLNYLDQGFDRAQIILAGLKDVRLKLRRYLKSLKATKWHGGKIILKYRKVNNAT